MTLVQKNVPNIADKFNIRGILMQDEPMWRHTTFRVGGPAAVFAVPEDVQDLAALFRAAKAEKMPLFILGGGSNLLVADEGINALVTDMRRFNGLEVRDNLLILDSGLDISDAAWNAGTRGLAGPDAFFGMPGTVGGAVWMNARCYGTEISHLLEWVEVMDPDGKIHTLALNPDEWAYKKSPFQNSDAVILRAALRVHDADPAELRRTMLEHRDDREAKGHFRAPCAGSAFKNNRDFGAPSGVLIDRCGLKGLRIGDAAVAPWHGNIVINDGKASARDIRRLLEKIAADVEAQTGFRMENEVLLTGSWPASR